MAAPAGQPFFGAGDIACTGGALEAAQQALGARVAAVLDAGGFALVAGGGHELAWGSFAGVVRHLGDSAPGTRIGVLNIDAHFDLRDARGGANSGTPFRQVADWCEANGAPFRYCVLGVSRAANNTPALYAAARARGAQWREDIDCRWSELPALRALIEGFVRSVDVLQFSVCLDAFPAASAPGVSAPAAPGVDKLISELMRVLAAEGIGLVSGYGRGLDRATFEVMLATPNGHAITVLPMGLNAFAKNTTKLDAAAAAGQVVLVSPFVPDTAFQEKLAEARNLLIDHLALALLILHADDDSLARGSDALDRDLPIFVGMTDTAGNRTLLDQGALLFTDPGEVVEEVQ